MLGVISCCSSQDSRSRSFFSSSRKVGISLRSSSAAWNREDLEFTTSFLDSCGEPSTPLFLPSSLVPILLGPTLIREHILSRVALGCGGGFDSPALYFESSGAPTQYRFETGGRLPTRPDVALVGGTARGFRTTRRLSLSRGCKFFRPCVG